MKILIILTALAISCGLVKANWVDDIEDQIKAELSYIGIIPILAIRCLPLYLEPLINNLLLCGKITISNLAPSEGTTIPSLA